MRSHMNRGALSETPRAKNEQVHLPRFYFAEHLYERIARPYVALILDVSAAVAAKNAGHKFFQMGQHLHHDTMFLKVLLVTENGDDFVFDDVNAIERCVIPSCDPSCFTECIAAVLRVVNANEDMGYVFHVFGRLLDVSLTLNVTGDGDDGAWTMADQPFGRGADKTL